MDQVGAGVGRITRWEVVPLFSNAFTISRLAGFDVRIDPSWLLIVTLIVWSLSQGYFPQSVPGQTDQTYLLLAICGALGFFGSLVLHELAHSLVARRLGVSRQTIYNWLNEIPQSDFFHDFLGASWLRENNPGKNHCQ